MVNVTYNNIALNLRIIENYFKNYMGIGCAFMNGRGYGLRKPKGFFRTQSIGQATSYLNGIEVEIFDKEYFKEIKKICENIENQEKIKVGIVIVEK